MLQRINKCSRMHQTCMSSRTDVDMSSFSEVTYWLGPPPYGLLKLPKLLIVRALEAARDAERDLETLRLWTTAHRPAATLFAAAFSAASRVMCRPGDAPSPSSAVSATLDTTLDDPPVLRRRGEPWRIAEGGGNRWGGTNDGPPAAAGCGPQRTDSSLTDGPPPFTDDPPSCADVSSVWGGERPGEWVRRPGDVCRPGEVCRPGDVCRPRVVCRPGEVWRRTRTDVPDDSGGSSVVSGLSSSGSRGLSSTMDCAPTKD